MCAIQKVENLLSIDCVGEIEILALINVSEELSGVLLTIVEKRIQIGYLIPVPSKSFMSSAKY